MLTKHLVVISEAWSNYSRRVDYGLTPVDLDKIAALIEADVPARLYYTLLETMHLIHMFINLTYIQDFLHMHQMPSEDL